MMTENSTNETNQRPNPNANFSLFDVSFSAYMEQYNEVFYRRLENILTIIQLVLGSSIVAQFGMQSINALIMVTISMFIFVVKPARVAEQSKTQYHRYLPLLTKQLTLNELETQFLEVQESDSSVLLTFNNIAYIRAGIEQGLDVSNEKLTFKEWLLARFVGETIKMKNNE